MYYAIYLSIMRVNNSNIQFQFLNILLHISNFQNEFIIIAMLYVLTKDA